MLHTGVEAFEAALNTINVGKFNLGFCSIGMAEHCFYETITQAEGRVLFGKRVTEFGQVRRILSEAYARLLAAKLYGARAVDYVRSASREDRRYLLFTPINKMQVTTEGERIVRLLAEVISAKGFERDSLLRERQEHHRRTAQARGNGPRQPRADAQVPPQLPVRERGRSTRRRRAATPPTTPSCSPRARPAGWARSPSRTGARSSTRFAATPNVARFREQADALVALRQRGAADARADDRRPRLPAVAGAAVHAHPVRPADPRAGAARRHARTTSSTSSSRRSCATSPRPPIDLHGKASSTDEQQAWALDEHPQAGDRRGPRRPHLRRGPCARRRLRDAGLTPRMRKAHLLEGERRDSNPRPPGPQHGAALRWSPAASAEAAPAARFLGFRRTRVQWVPGCCVTTLSEPDPEARRDESVSLPRNPPGHAARRGFHSSMYGNVTARCSDYGAREP